MLNYRLRQEQNLHIVIPMGYITKLRTVWIAILFSLTLSLGAVTQETGCLEQFLFGTEPACSYDNWVSHVAENVANPGFNFYAPWDRQTPGFGSFVVPDASQLITWSNAIALFINGDLDGAQAILNTSEFPFQIVEFTDSGTSKVYYILRENLSDAIDDNGTEDATDDEIGSFNFGWGIYIYYPGSPNPMIVTAPHPCDDFPSPMMAWEVFNRCDARWLMINGAGREVAYQGTYYNSNNASLSDPSRYSGHPLNVVYQKAADNIRSQYGREEFSVQVHTYDRFRPGIQRDVQLSAGNGRYFPTLPIRDLSRRKLDIIHQMPYIVHPAYAYGNHREVTITDYYSVYYGQGSPVYYTRDGYNVMLSNNPDYPGSMQNQQMLYTTQEYESQTLSPFLHVEMAELPQTFMQTEDEFNHFYGWNTETGAWDPAQRYTRFRAYYLPWIDGLAAVLPEMFELDDFEPPSDPENLYCSVQYSSLKLGWQRSYSYDFDSYETHYTYMLNGQWVTSMLDRNDDPDMGRQNYELDTLPYTPFHSITSIMTFKVRARDIHGNVSGFSNPVSFSYPSNNIQSFSISSLPDRNYLSWTGATGSTTTSGYNIYRSTDGFNFSLYDSWVTNPQLSPPAQNSGNYSDTAVMPGTPYYYKIGRVFSNGNEYLDYRVVKGSPLIIYPLVTTRINTGNTANFSFGMSPFSTNGTDTGLDQLFDFSSETPFCIGSVTSDSFQFLSRDIRPVFDPESVHEVYDLMFYTSTNGESFRFALPDSVMTAGFTVLLEDLTSHSWTDLTAQAYILNNAPYGVRHLRLYWGKYLPSLTIAQGQDVYAQPRQLILLSWELTAPLLVGHLELRLSGETQEFTIFPNLPPGFSNYEYMVPLTLISGTYRFKIVTYLLDGSQFVTVSDWRIHLYDSVYQVSGNAGIRFLSFPTTSVYSTMIDLFGEECGFWTIGTDGNWHYNEEMIFNRPYLARFDVPYSITLPNLPYMQAQGRVLAPGWSFIANPHQRDYQMKDLRFRVGNSYHTAAELTASGSLFPRFLVIRDRAMELSDVLPEGESAFIRILSSDPVELILDPANYSDAVCAIPRSWELTFRAVQASDATSVILGSSISDSAAYDPRWDIASTEIPELPIPGLKFDLLGPEAETPSRYLAKYTGLYPDWDTVSRVWNFELDLPSLSPVSLNCSSFDLPSDYRIELSLNGEVTEMTTSDTYTFQPLQTGILRGSITVTAHAPAGTADLTNALRQCRAYPNPFASSLMIELPRSLRSYTELEIFNLRGQKVRTIFTGIPDKAVALQWNGKDSEERDCAKGIYFLRITSGRSSHTIKLLRL
ncbi:MAG TPA: T9SS type A sorting domain-containing protein [Candidatus Cloacimonadota bacterium]|nr:T9SS type A sorting domain-containing protein [Candidatus Cloacimonadota bacterium]